MSQKTADVIDTVIASLTASEVASLDHNGLRAFVREKAERGEMDRATLLIHAMKYARSLRRDD